MRSELTKISSDQPFVMVGERTASASARATDQVVHIAARFARFLSIQSSLVELYTQLSNKEWKAFEEDCYNLLTTKLKPSPEDGPLFSMCRNELRTLELLNGANKAIQEFNAINALILLKQARELLNVWFRSFDSNSASKPSGPTVVFFLSFGSRKRSSLAKLGLIQFLLHFYHTIMAKFSLYFFDTFVQFAPQGELKQAFSTPISFLQLFQTFVRKSNVHTLCLLVNRIDQETPFKGFGYNYLPPPQTGKLDGQQSASPGATELVVGCGQRTPSSGASLSDAKSMHSLQSCGCRRDIQGGICDKYPVLFILPSERRNDPHSHFATICAFVQEGCGGGAATVMTTTTATTGATTISTSSGNLLPAESGGKIIRYLYDRNKDQTFFTACVEGNVHLVATFERRVQERDTAVHTFFAEALGGLKCTKLLHEIRSICK